MTCQCTHPRADHIDDGLCRVELCACERYRESLDARTTPLPPPTRRHVRDGFDVYIGRPARTAFDPRCRELSPYRNPFVLTEDRNRTAAHAEFETLWRVRLARKSRRKWLALLSQLAGYQMGCWCESNEPCHGDVLIKLFREFVGEGSRG